VTRISRIVNETIVYMDEIVSWLDIGSGNGQVIKALSWEPFVRRKYYVEEEDVENCLGPSWDRVDYLDLVGYSFSLITMFDVIEHMNKQDGLNHLDYIDKISEHSIIFTPEGFFPQAATEDNPHMLHKSGWEADELENKGYKVLVLKDFHYHSDLGRKFNALLAWK